MDIVTSAYNDPMPDALTPRMLALLELLKKDCRSYNYVGGKPFTTISFELYNTTSAWWIILYLNGYMHPDEVSSGSLLKVPSSEIIQVFLQETKVNNVGKRVTT